MSTHTTPSTALLETAIGLSVFAFIGGSAVAVTFGLIDLFLP